MTSSLKSFKKEVIYTTVTNFLKFIVLLTESVACQQSFPFGYQIKLQIDSVKQKGNRHILFICMCQSKASCNAMCNGLRTKFHQMQWKVVCSVFFWHFNGILKSSLFYTQRDNNPEVNCTWKSKYLLLSFAVYQNILT